MANFWVRNTIILSVLVKKFFFTCSKIKLFTIFMIFLTTKNGRTTKFFSHSSFEAVVGSGIGKDKNSVSGILDKQPTWIRNTGASCRI